MTAQPGFYERKFAVRGVGARPLDDTLILVNGAGALWTLAFGLHHAGARYADIAEAANEHEKLGTVAPAGGWTAGDIEDLLTCGILVTSLSIHDYPWTPRPR